MNNNRLGCLSPIAFIATLVTLIVIIGLELTSGNSLFSPGSLNAQAGNTIGGVASHAEIGSNCGTCHPAPWSPDTLATRCLVCHADVSAQLQDATSLHGTMTKNGNSACRNCHPEHRGANVSLTNLDVRDFPHDAAGYSLRGHPRLSNGLTFTCADCHGNDISKFDLATCAACHQQTDSAFMQTHIAEYGDACLACHDGRDSLGKQFTHANFPFKLDGKHAGLTCVQCHANARATADFKSAPVTCVDCHQKDDKHDGQFGANCGVCHSPASWEDAKFDHNLSAFKLEGKHVEVDCAKCHINNVFKGTPDTCFGCHQKDDKHNGQFGQDCAACHTPKTWDDATFDHNLSAFKLDGGHINVACEKCHINNVFKGTSTACASCHQDPAFHLGMFPGQACSDCHTTAAWQPAQYNGQHTFPMNHGEKNNTCADCHQPTLTRWTCYTCHDQREMAQKHQEEKFTNFEDCLRCHATGQKEEEGRD